MPQEFEITLAVPTRALAALPEHPLLRELGADRAVRRDLATTYWDTASCVLYRGGITLRMRQQDEVWLQSLKAASDGSFRRGEVEHPARAAVPDLEAAKVAARELGVRWPRTAVDLEPMFVTRIERTTWSVDLGGGTQVEIAADRGEIVGASDGASAPVSEIEIELEEGSELEAYELAYRLLGDLPQGRLLFESKAQRGYELASGLHGAPRRARRLRIGSSWTTRQLLEASGRECLTQIQANMAGARRGEDPAFVHQLRIGVRRLRTVLSVCERAGLLEPETPMKAGLRGLWQVLGHARDWDVFVTRTWPSLNGTTRGHAPGAPPGSLLRDTPATAAFDAEVRATRARAHRRLRRTLDAPDTQKVLLALGGFFALVQEERGALPRPAKLARRLLDRQHRRLVRHGSHLERDSPDTRHRARIDAKKLRYLVEFFGSLFPAKPQRVYLGRLSELQDVLGTLNDAAVTGHLPQPAYARVPEREAIVVSALLQGHTAASMQCLLPVLGPAWRRLRSAKPFWH